jgi:hypothetical protein
MDAGARLGVFDALTTLADSMHNDGVFDLNPVQFDLEFDFTVGDMSYNWTASGRIIATGGGDGDAGRSGRSGRVPPVPS